MEIAEGAFDKAGFINCQTWETKLSKMSSGVSVEIGAANSSSPAGLAVAGPANDANDISAIIKITR